MQRNFFYGLKELAHVTDCMNVHLVDFFFSYGFRPQNLRDVI